MTSIMIAMSSQVQAACCSKSLILNKSNRWTNSFGEGTINHFLCAAAWNGIYCPYTCYWNVRSLIVVYVGKCWRWRKTGALFLTCISLCCFWYELWPAQVGTQIKTRAYVYLARVKLLERTVKYFVSHLPCVYALWNIYIKCVVLRFWTGLWCMQDWLKRLYTNV